jgi:hypothetical protein
MIGDPAGKATWTIVLMLTLIVPNGRLSQVGEIRRGGQYG